jgi:hypothetical protein
MSNTLLSNIVAPSAIVQLSATQTLTNKTISLGSNSITGTTTQFNSGLTDDQFASLNGSQTLNNKIINGGSF